MNLAGAVPSECRRVKNNRHLLTGLFRQSLFGRVAVYEDVNDADRLAHDQAATVSGDATKDRIAKIGKRPNGRGNKRSGQKSG